MSLLAGLFLASSFSSSRRSVLSIKYGVVLLLATSCWVTETGSDSAENEAFDPPGKGMGDVGGNLQKQGGSGDIVEVRKCKTELDKTFYGDVKENLLLGKIKYTEDSVKYELNLVEELARGNLWEKVAEQTDWIKPENIRAHYKETKQELLESSHRLFKKLHQMGYKDEFNWDAYIKGFKNTENKKLTHAINKLEEMLKCAKISRKAIAAVKPQHFHSLQCEGKTLNLEVDMAEEWRSIAREFEIPAHTIFYERNIPEQCSREVLTQLHKNASSWQQIIDLISKADKRIGSWLESAIDNYCVE